ncbi:MAG: L-fucose mutarotase [Lentisphaerae bacterium ADurb.Bin082]|nr:MAG: L-fucose mutarotase [Lentisphaerae bacterium ADurb.Bin082]
MVDGGCGIVRSSSFSLQYVVASVRPWSDLHNIIARINFLYEFACVDAIQANVLSVQLPVGSREVVDAMLKGIAPCISPELLKSLAEMGHGDKIVLADAHFPSHTLGPRVIRADGLGIPELLRGILPLFELDAYVAHPVAMMAPVAGDSLDADYVHSCSEEVAHHCQSAIDFVERFAFYDLARTAYCIVHTGETRKYGNIILQKGVTPCP